MEHPKLTITLQGAAMSGKSFMARWLKRELQTHSAFKNRIIAVVDGDDEIEGDIKNASIIIKCIQTN